VGEITQNQQVIRRNFDGKKKTCFFRKNITFIKVIASYVCRDKGEALASLVSPKSHQREKSSIKQHKLNL